MLSRFHLIPERHERTDGLTDGRTDEQTHRQNSYINIARQWGGGRGRRGGIKFDTQKIIKTLLELTLPKLQFILNLHYLYKKNYNGRVT